MTFVLKRTRYSIELSLLERNESAYAIPVVIDQEVYDAEYPPIIR